MKSRISILNKSKNCNKKCNNCKHYLSSKQLCMNSLSINYKTLCFKYNRCKSFEWHDNVIDRNTIRTCEFCKSVYVDTNRAIPICLKLAKINNICENDYKLLWYLIVCNENNCLK